MDTMDGMSKQKTDARQLAVRTPRAVHTRRPSARETKSIGGLFPVAYLKIIEQEAAALGQSKTGFPR